MSDIKQVDVKGWSLVVGQDDEPRVRDLDLGERLGYARPADFRKLVKRLIGAGIIKDSEAIATVSRAKMGPGWRDVTEYHLTQTGALIAISRSDTTAAVAITRQMVEVFIAYRTPSPATVLDLSIIHGARIGDGTVYRLQLSAACRVAAQKTGTSVRRIHGLLRRHYKVSSVYLISVLAMEAVKEFLKYTSESFSLHSKPPHLRLVQGGQARQLTLAV